MFFHRCRLATIPYGCSLVMKTLRFTTLPGDGIGPEVMEVALKVLDDLGSKHGFCVESTTQRRRNRNRQPQACLLHPVRLRTSRRYSFRLGRRTSEKTFHPRTARKAALLPLRQGFRALCQSTPRQPCPNWPTCPSAPTNRGQRNRRSCVRELTGGVYLANPSEPRP